MMTAFRLAITILGLARTFLVSSAVLVCVAAISGCWDSSLERKPTYARMVGPPDPPSSGRREQAPAPTPTEPTTPAEPKTVAEAIERARQPVAAIKAKCDLNTRGVSACQSAYMKALYALDDLEKLGKALGACRGEPASFDGDHQDNGGCKQVLAYLFGSRSGQLELGKPVAGVRRELSDFGWDHDMPAHPNASFADELIAAVERWHRRWVESCRNPGDDPWACKALAGFITEWPEYPGVADDRAIIAHMKEHLDEPLWKKTAIDDCKNPTASNARCSDVERYLAEYPAGKHAAQARAMIAAAEPRLRALQAADERANAAEAAAANARYRKECVRRCLVENVNATRDHCEETCR